MYVIKVSENVIIRATGGKTINLQDNTGGNLTFGVSTIAGTSAVYTFVHGNGTAPSTSPADCYQLYSADIAAGHAAPHVRNENGTTIKLYQQAANADTSGATLATLEIEVNELKQLLRNNGLMAA